MRLRTGQAGTAGFAWREAGQKDFPTQQVVLFDCRPSTDWQEYRVTIPATNNVIHVRLLLPAGGADVEAIELQDARGKTRKSWRFGKE